MVEYAPYPDGTQPPVDSKRYFRTTQLAPSLPTIEAPVTISEITGPLFSREGISPDEADLTEGGKALGQLMVLAGQVRDEDARPLPGVLVEVWQANASGKYRHPVDGRDAPLDPHFVGGGRAVTDSEGRYRFVTIKPGAYPVPNSGNWWRPPHIHLSIYGYAFLSRMISQVYFPGDPLNELDSIFMSVPDADARSRLVATPDTSVGLHEHALGYGFDIVLRGRDQTPMEAEGLPA